MTNMLKTIVPKSDQLNADDLIGGRTMTIKITKVELRAGDQPVALQYEGGEGKPYLPCKSMRRVLVNVWGSDGNAYVGRLLTIYRDDKVKFGGVDVGGIRISHMSDITEEITLALTAAKAVRKPYVVKPLKVAPPADPAILKAGDEAAAKGVAKYTEWLGTLSPEQKDTIRHKSKEWTKTAKDFDAQEPEINI